MIRKFKPVKGAVLPSKYGAFDCETEGLYGDARLICLVIPGQPDRSFRGDDCVKEFIDEVTRPKYRGYHLYAHNLSFDLEKTFGKAGNTMDNREFSLVTAGTRLIKAVYNFGNNKRLTLLDTMNLIPASLASIGEDLGYKKLKTPEKWLSGEPVTDITDKDIDYCIRDCKIVLKILDVYAEMLEPFKIKLKVTAAANAKAVWKAIELKDSGMFLNEDKDERFRESYYGGRTETFIRRYERLKLYYYDINSMYPSAMRDNNKFPDPDRLKYSKDLGKALKEHEGCAKITVSIPDMPYPPLPYRDQKLIFPTGEITGTWNFPEIRLAIEKGCSIVETHWVLSSPPIDSPFDRYVGYFMGLKIRYHNEGKTALKNLAKRMLNSLYGKFAQRVDIEDRYTHDEPGIGVAYRKMGDNTYKLKNVDKERGKETVVCWSSYITSYARVLLYSFFPENAGLYYCDTDSIVIDHELPPELVHESEFGLMSLEDVVVESYFVAPKRYAYKNDRGETTRKIKGVHKDVVNGIPLESFGESVGVFYHKPLKPKTALRKGLKPYSKEIVRKCLKTTDDKRTFDDNGDSVPIHYTLS